MQLPRNVMPERNSPSDNWAREAPKYLGVPLLIFLQRPRCPLGVIAELLVKLSSVLDTNEELLVDQTESK